jgi:hypothetical protein
LSRYNQWDCRVDPLLIWSFGRQTRQGGVSVDNVERTLRRCFFAAVASVAAAVVISMSRVVLGRCVLSMASSFFKRLLKTPIARGCKASRNAIVSAFLLHVGGGSMLVQFRRGCQFFRGIAFQGIEPKNSTARFVLPKIQEKIITCRNSGCALPKFSQLYLPLHT